MRDEERHVAIYLITLDHPYDNHNPIALHNSFGKAVTFAVLCCKGIEKSKEFLGRVMGIEPTASSATNLNSFIFFIFY